MNPVWVDPEGPGLGGGIRTYIQHCLIWARSEGLRATVFTNAPESYPKSDSTLTIIKIERISKIPLGLRKMLYVMAYAEAVVFEQSAFLAAQMSLKQFSTCCFEFADYQGLAFFPLRNPALKNRIRLRVHTPLFCIPGFNQGASWFAHQITRYRELWCLKTARTLFAPSLDFINEKLPLFISKSIRSPNPPPPFVSDIFLKKKNVRGDSIQCLVLGRIEPRKGQHIALAAFCRLADRFPNLYLDFIGGNSDKHYFQEMEIEYQLFSADWKSRVRFLPPQKLSSQDLNQNYQMLLLPSLWENSPYVCFEAMAAKILLLCAKTGEMKRLADQNLVRGFVPGSSLNLALIWAELLSNPDLWEQILVQQNTALEQVQIEANAALRSLWIS